MRHARGLFAAASIAVLAAACSGGTDSSPDTTQAKGASTTTAAAVADRGNVDGTLEIGFLAPETGPMAAVVSSVTTPVDQAIDEINAAGGVNGKDVVLTVRDDGADPQIASASFDQLVTSDKIDALLGPATSPTTLAVLEKIKSDGVVTCGGSATAIDLSEADSGGYYFRTAPPDRFQGPALAELILGDGHTKVAIIARDDSYGQGLSEVVASALENSGAEVADPVLYDPSGSNFEGDVQKVVAQDPDAVVLIGFSDDAALIVKELTVQGAGPADLPMYTTDGFQNPGFGAMVDPTNPAVVAGIKGTAPAASPAGVDSPFMETFVKSGVPPIFSAYYYDCTLLTALAAQAAGSDDPAEIKDAFAANLDGETDCSTYADCKEILEDGGTIHYRGASNSFDTWAGFEPGSGAYDVWAFDEQGQPVTGDADEQIKIAG